MQPFYYQGRGLGRGIRATLPHPPGTRDFQHEMELVVALGAGVSGSPRPTPADDLRLRLRSRHDPPRPVAGRPRSGPAVGPGPRTSENAAVLSAIVPNGRVLGQGAIGLQVNGTPPGRRPRPDDLEHPRADRRPLPLPPPAARRPVCSPAPRRVGRRRPGRPDHRPGSEGVGEITSPSATPNETPRPTATGAPDAHGLPLRAVATAGDAVAAPCLDHDAASGFTRPVVIDIGASCTLSGRLALLSERRWSMSGPRGSPSAPR